ncbi:hypothetical protein M885DRAFT_516480 [Pelagophyceae sp. CCMP2097]|nr:hypothetical protein M885DRAFT_516480 [Pelagophyceae sp. CCMP2097]
MESSLAALLRLSVDSSPPPPPRPPRDESGDDEEELRTARHIEDLLGTEARTSFAAAWDAESSCSDRPPLPPPSDRGQSTLRQTAPAQHRGDRRRVEQLAVSRLEEFEARETLRRAMEEERLLATCTFQPRLSARRKSARAADDLGVSERLHSEAVHRAEVRALERAAVAEAEVAACRFQPHINDSSLHFGDSRPLHERVADVERAASLRRLELRAERDRANEEAHVFQPQINVDARSAAMAKRATDRAFKTMMEAAHLSQQLSDETANAEHPPDVAARLAADAWHRSMCGQQRLEAAEAEAAAERSRAARTKISRGSERIAASAPSIGGVPFFERERRRESEARRRRAADEEERRAEEERLFQPAISGRSAKLDERATRRRLLEAAAAADAAAAGGAGAAGPAAAPESRVARLAADAAAKEEKRAQRESEYYSQWNYKPETNARKADAAAKADYDELSRNARGSAARSRAEKEAFERQQSQCTFKPQLISKPSDKSNVKTEAERRAVKEIKIEAERKQRELDELRECSFRPSTNSKSTLREAAPAASTGAATTVKPVVVRGLARHLELRNRAKQLAQDHRSREHAAFTVERAEEWRHGQKFTTPQPFALSTGVL